MMTYPKRGEIWYVEFEPNVGTEIDKTRPALIISNNHANELRTKVTLIPLTGTIPKHYSFIVYIIPDSDNNLNKNSTIIVPDIVTFDKSRIKNKIGFLNPKTMNEVVEKLKIHLDIR